MAANDIPVHLIGTPAFFPALIAYIRSSANSPSLPLDEVIIKSLLLCIIAGGKHLILRTPEEDIGLVAKLVVWTLSSIFSYPTHKVKIRTRSRVTASNSSTLTESASFLRSLFLPSNTSSSNSNQTLQDETLSESSKTKHPSGHRQHGHAKLSKHELLTSEHTRSVSYPNDLAQIAESQGVNALQSHHANVPHGPELKGQNSNDDPFKSSAALKASPRLQHSFTDTVLYQRKHVVKEPKQPRSLPRALVLSGLENASVSTQRSLVRVLAERRVVLECDEHDGHNFGPQMTQFGGFDANSDIEDHNGEHASDFDGVWNLPDGFIVVYVCPINAKERPGIHKSLLDKFAMSNNIYTSQSIRHALRSLPFSPIHTASHPHFFSHSNPGSPSPTYPIPLPQSHTPPHFTKQLPSLLPSRNHNHSNPPTFSGEVFPSSFLDLLQQCRQQTYMAPSLSLLLSDLFSAMRHHPKLDGTLLTANAMKDVKILAHAARVLGSDPTGMELIRPTMKSEDMSDFEYLEGEYYKLPEHDATNGFQSNVSLKALATSQGKPEDIPILNVVEADVSRLMPRVVTHRLRLRDGPEDEVLASAVIGATFAAPDAEADPDIADDVLQDLQRDYGGLVIKDVLIEVMNKV